MRICLCIVSDSSYSHPHTLPITCTCCYDEIKGTQAQDFSCSYSDSPSLSPLCIILGVIMRSKEFNTSNRVLMLIFCMNLSRCLSASAFLFESVSLYAQACVLSMQQLQILSLDGCAQLSDDLLDCIGSGSKMLIDLDLSHCHAMSAAGLCVSLSLSFTFSLSLSFTFSVSLSHSCSHALTLSFAF